LINLTNYQISESPLDASPARRLAFMPDGRSLISAHNETLKVCLNIVILHSFGSLIH